MHLLWQLLTFVALEDSDDDDDDDEDDAGIWYFGHTSDVLNRISENSNGAISKHPERGRESKRGAKSEIEATISWVIDKGWQSSPGEQHLSVCSIVVLIVT